MDKLLKFFPLVKVDEATRMVYGLVTAQAEDKDGEICDYSSTKPEYEKVNAELGKASGGENIMPLREMHQLNAVGAGKSIEFDDTRKQIRMAFKVVDDSAWKKVTEKVLLGFSQGGRYLKRWKENGKDFYTAQPGEVSLVDNPCLPGAFIEYAKADGTVELFKTQAFRLSDSDVEKITKSLRADLEKGVKYLVPGGTHLPYTDESGKPDHAHMGAAWAALHGGYRGNKYEGPGKQHAIARLKEIYHSQGIQTPSEKAFSAIEMLKSEFGADSILGTDLEDFVSDLNALVEYSATGDSMKPEDIKKCAAALGITEDEFTKTYIEGGILAKAKHGIAALHSHMETAMAHHDGMMKAHHDMMKAHTAMAAMHEKHSGHLDKCMKACKAVMGSDDKEAEKAIKALVDELGIKTESTTGEAFSKADAETLVAAAVAKAEADFQKKLDALPAPPAAKLFGVNRDGEVKKAMEASDPLPV